MEVKWCGGRFDCHTRLNNEHLALLPTSLMRVLLPQPTCSLHRLAAWYSLQTGCLLWVLDRCDKIGQRPVAEDLRGLGPRERRHEGSLHSRLCPMNSSTLWREKARRRKTRKQIRMQAMRCCENRRAAAKTTWLIRLLHGSHTCSQLLYLGPTCHVFSSTKLPVLPRIARKPRKNLQISV